MIGSARNCRGQGLGPHSSEKNEVQRFFVNSALLGVGARGLMNVLAMPSLSASGKHVRITSPRGGVYTERPTCHDRDVRHPRKD